MDNGFVTQFWKLYTIPIFKICIHFTIQGIVLSFLNWKYIVKATCSSYCGVRNYLVKEIGLGGHSVLTKAWLEFCWNEEEVIRIHFDNTRFCDLQTPRLLDNKIHQTIMRHYITIIPKVYEHTWYVFQLIFVSTRLKKTLI